MTASIDGNSKTAILDELQLFSLFKKRKRTKHQLPSLIGKLSFTCKVLPSGHIFLHRLIDLSMAVKHPPHHLPISVEAKRDLAWWQDFLPSWSVTSFILDTHWTPSSEMQLFTDAPGLLRMGCLLEWSLAAV